MNAGGIEVELDHTGTSLPSPRSKSEFSSHWLDHAYTSIHHPKEKPSFFWNHRKRILVHAIIPVSMAPSTCRQMRPSKRSKQDSRVWTAWYVYPNHVAEPSNPVYGTADPTTGSTSFYRHQSILFWTGSSSICRSIRLFVSTPGSTTGGAAGSGRRKTCYFSDKKRTLSAARFFFKENLFLYDWLAHPL
jgi:hypothetical protein